MNIKFLSLIVAFFLYSSLVVNASEDTSVSFGVQFSTLGAGITGEIPVTQHVALRGSVNALAFTLNESISDTDYDLDMTSQSAGLFLDYHPFEGNFRTSIGALFHNTEMNGVAHLNASTSIGSYRFDRDELQSLEADLKYPSLLPYLGIGWGSNWGASRAWGISFDIGVAFLSDPDITLSATGSVVNETLFIEALKQEELDAEADASDIAPIYPVITFGIHYRF